MSSNSLQDTIILKYLIEILEKLQNLESNNDDRPQSIDQASKYINVSKSYMYQLVSQKKISYFKPSNGKIYFLKPDLDKYILKNKTTAVSELEETAESISEEVYENME
jgi:excisionase family DNA binding protein